LDDAQKPWDIMASVLCNKPESTGPDFAKLHLDTSKSHHSPRIFPVSTERLDSQLPGDGFQFNV
jgi:hypothetical protein